MSGAAPSQNSSAAKASTDDATKTPQQTDSQDRKPQLEEDDEFEDFPIEGAVPFLAYNDSSPQQWNQR